MSYARFALYVVPDDVALADFGAQWLGWDIRRGRAVPQFPIAGLHDASMTPRKYGFHGTIKPPFRLADGTDADGLGVAIEDVAGTVAPVVMRNLEVAAMGGFLALRPTAPVDALLELAARFVKEIDPFRAPAGAEELQRRRANGLTETQDRNLIQWGYPYVLDEFRFHMTLTGRLDTEAQQHWMQQAIDALPIHPVPLTINSIALVGEREDGRFELLHRYALTG